MTFEPTAAQVVQAPVLWQIFTDRDTSDFLFNGYLYFFHDNARTIGKPVYQMTGTGNPPTPPYSFIQYGQWDGTVDDSPWIVNLNSQGAFDFQVFLCPFLETSLPTQVIDLYFIEVYNASGVLQFTLEGQPFSGSIITPSNSGIAVNYIPNSQFLLHNNIPYIPPAAVGTVPPKLDVFNIAPGGWWFERSAASTAVDIITFPSLGSPVSSPPNNPIYYLHFNCTSPDGTDAVKDITVRYPGVNTFTTQAPNASQVDTFSFWGEPGDSGSYMVNVIRKQFFGTGGSAEVTTVFTPPITISGAWSQYFIPITSVDNTGKTIGPNGDDYVAYGLRYPPTSSCNVNTDNYIFTPGNVNDPILGDVTAYQVVSQSLAGSSTIPDYNEFDLGLPVILGQNGFTYDQGGIGQILLTAQTIDTFGYLVCDGQTSYDTNLYSSDNIPYARLGNKVFNSTLNAHLFGNGPQFINVGINADTITLRLSTNSVGGVTATADGAVPTDFTFNACHLGTSVLLTTANYAGTNLIYIFNAGVGLTSAPNDKPILPGTTTFTTSVLNYSPSTIGRYAAATVASTAITGGQYFTFWNTAGQYYVWYTVQGAGSDPAPGGTGIKVELYTTPAMTAADVAMATTEALNQFQNSFITCTSGATVTAGSYFTFSTNANNYYAWYNVSGTGTDPMLANKIGIEVQILTGDTAAQVAFKTQTALNSRYFAAPDVRGTMFRLWSNGQTGFDLDFAMRYSQNTVVQGDYVGTYEWYQVQAHEHQVGSFSGDIDPTGSTLLGINPEETPFTLTTQTDFTSGLDYEAPFGYTDYQGDYSTNTATLFQRTDSGSETRPINLYVNAFIRY